MIDDIKEKFDKEYKFNIYKSDQKRRSAYARKGFVYLCKQLGYTYQVIGEAIGVKHDNAIYYYKTIHTINEIDKRIYNRIAKSISGDLILFEVKELQPEIKELKQFNGIFTDFNELLELGEGNVKEFIETRLKPYLRMKQLNTNKL